jgi:hypothetical protein
MKISQQIFIKRWKPILEEYEKIKNKLLPRSFINPKGRIPRACPWMNE